MRLPSRAQNDRRLILGTKIRAEGEPMATTIQPAVSATKNDQIIEALAKETEVPVERVREIYESECSRLDADARVKTYVSVIATRLVRRALHSK
jgi:Protein of unknown function (DUF3562)